MTAAGWLSLAGVAVALAGLVFTLARARAADITTLHDRITKLATEMTGRAVALETKVELFWRSVSLPAAAVLHSPHPEHARRDALLESLMAGRLDVVEAAELARMVEEIRADPAVPAVEQLAAGAVLGYLAAKFGLPGAAAGSVHDGS